MFHRTHPHVRNGKRTAIASAKVRGVITAGIGISIEIGFHHLFGTTQAVLAGWDVAALAYVIWVAIIGLPLSAKETGELASTEDPGRATTDALIVLASIASLIAVGFLLTSDSGSSVGRIGFAVVSVVISWILLHTVFALHYAKLYYSDPHGGIDFNEKERPDYHDFAYLAFTAGMTFQVADTNLQTKPIRRSVLRHALLSYLFGTVIVATMINLVAGLSK